MQTRQPLPPKMRQRPHVRTLFRQLAPPRLRHGALSRPHHAQLPHPQRQQRARNPRARRPRPPIPMRAMTCSRWPITTWTACDRARSPVTRLFRRYPGQETATNIARSGKDGPASPPKPSGSQVPLRGRPGTPREAQPDSRGSACPALLSRCQALAGMALCYVSSAQKIASMIMKATASVGIGKSRSVVGLGGRR